MTKQIQTVDEKLKAEISGALARAYCYVENSRKQMDSDLLKAMGRELEPVFFQAQQEAVERGKLDDFDEYKMKCFPGTVFADICETLMDKKSIEELSMKEQIDFWNGIKTIAFWTKEKKHHEALQTKGQNDQTNTDSKRAFR